MEARKRLAILHQDGLKLHQDGRRNYTKMDEFTPRYTSYSHCPPCQVHGFFPVLKMTTKFS